ncbi:MAG: HAD-IB family phosphatase [Crenarchaeota archaeon]|nr:HAD-IB family phosphatase [Thermoproteota archaeon]
MVRIIFFDMDGTLVEEESSWRIVHKFLGTDHLARRALEKFSRGEINYEEFVKHDVSLWPRRLPRSFFELVFSSVRVKPDARMVFNQLKSRGFLRVIVSSGLDVLAEKVCRMLAADECVSNRMIFDCRGFFTGVVEINVDPSRKMDVLNRVCEKYSIPLNEAAAVGDTVHDKSMFKAVKISILCVKPGVPVPDAHGAMFAMNSLKDIIQLLC